MARETLLEDQDTRLKIVAEIIIPEGCHEPTRIYAERLRDFILGPRMPGWCDNQCFTVKIENVEEPADGKEIP